MALENVPGSVASDGNLRIAFVPSGSNAKSVAILNAAPVKDLTYSFTPDGFTRTITENTVEDARLTLKQILSRPGTKTETVEVKYVYGAAVDIAAVALTEGVTGSLTCRYVTPNATVWTSGQKVDVLAFVAGAQRKDAPTANGLFTISQTLYLTAVTETDALLVA